MSDRRLKDDIQRLAHVRPGLDKLAAATDPAPILAKTGLGSVARKIAGSDGIASPLTEQDYAARTWHGATHTLTSTDGLFTIEYVCLESVTLLDANSAQVVMQYEDEP